MDRKVVVGLGVSAFLYAAGSYAFAQLTLNPTRQPIVRKPSDFGLEYEDVGFASRDGLRLKGWYIPGRSARTLVVTHPMFCNRHGFLARHQSRLTSVTQDVELLPALRAFQNAGYSVLTFDFRNHGESEGGVTGVGLNEFPDVLGALDYLRSDHAHACSEIGMVGFCMGANATIVAMSRAREAFADVRCFVAVQPVSFDVFVRSYLSNRYTPAGLALVPGVDRVRRLLGGHSLAAMSPRDHARGISVPTLYVQARQDPWTDVRDIRGFYDQTSAEKELWWLEGPMSRLDAYNYVGQHPGRVVEFLDRHLAGS